MFIFFVNKPISVFFYLLALPFIFLLVINGNFEPIVSFLTGVFSFSVWYFLVLIRYYVFSSEEIIFLGSENESV